MSDTPEAPETIRFWPATDVGRVRKANEDSFLVDKKLSLFIVADGMGGHAAGEVASSMTCRVVREALAAERDALTAFAQGDTSVDRKDILRLVEASIQEACSKVHQEGLIDESKRGMGTTVDALLIVGTRGFIGHVGDSRIYLYRQGSVHQLTEDHSLVNELLRRGKLTREQIDKSAVQYKNAVTRAVGVYASVEVDVFDFDVLAGDRFLLCSDGLSGYLNADSIRQVVESQPSARAACEDLVGMVKSIGGHDDVTVAMARFQGVAPELAKVVKLPSRDTTPVEVEVPKSIRLTAAPGGDADSAQAST